jgi:D-isomer specific 2-hydroxyacid dehydrogenase, NAD binding domain
VALCTLFGAQRHVHTFPRVLGPREMVLMGRGGAPAVNWGAAERRGLWGRGLRVLVVGDPYMPVSAYASALAGLDGRVELTTMQIDDVTLEQGRLGGAALDVLERTADRHPLLTMPNVFVTPHIGGATAQTLTRGAQRAVTAVAELLAGRVPANVVNPAALQAQAIHGSAAG